MDHTILEALLKYTSEEEEILKNNRTFNETLYMQEISKQLVIDIDKLNISDQMINIRKHPRFAKVPRHKHNYVEMSYVYHGSMTQIVDGRKIEMKEGELIFLNQYCVHEIEETSEQDCIVNFIIHPDFFRYLISLADSTNQIFDFLLRTIYFGNQRSEYLYFNTGQVEAIRNIVENIVKESIVDNADDAISKIKLKLLVGELIVEAMRCSRNVEFHSQEDMEKMLNMEVLRYIDDEFVEGSLQKISKRIGLPPYRTSRLVKKYTGFTFKQLVQDQRLRKAVEILLGGDYPIVRVMEMIGYENITYFYKIFKEKYNVTPNEYKQNYKHKMSENSNRK